MVDKLITSILQKSHNDGATFGQVLQRIYQTVPVEGKLINLSSGYSAARHPSFLRHIVLQDSKHNSFNFEYQNPGGDNLIRLFISEIMNLRTSPESFSAESVLITDGGTMAVKSILYALQDLSGNILIPSPNYYIYKEICELYGYAYKEIDSYDVYQNIMRSDITALIKNIDSYTKAIILTLPSNPLSDLVKREELIKLLSKVKTTSCYIILNEIFASTEDQAYIPDFLQLAYETGILHRIIIVSSISKTLNLPALRSGYIIGLDSTLMNKIKRYIETSISYAAANINTSSIALHCSLQYLSYHKDGQSQVYDLLNKIKINVDSIQLDRLKKWSLTNIAIYREYRNYCNRIIGQTNACSGFNSFHCLAHLGGINQLDFAINIFLDMGIKTQLGPYFGRTQKAWGHLPPFVRISYSYPMKIFKENIKKFSDYTTYYTNKRNKPIYDTTF